MIALVGVILLIGIVKKNGIMMVDFAISAERADGETPLNAIRQACLLRFRPILMTTMAALLSGVPLMLGTGAGSELRRPLGFAMVGGLMLSQVAHAIHDAGDLSLSRPAATSASRRNARGCLLSRRRWEQRPIDGAGGRDSRDITVPPRRRLRRDYGRAPRPRARAASRRRKPRLRRADRRSLPARKEDRGCHAHGWKRLASDSRAFPPERLRELRAREARDAVAALGLSTDRLHFLGVRDTAAPHGGPEFDEVAARLASLAQSFGAATICATWAHDPHGDHVSAHHLAKAACARTGARLLSYPIWGWTLAQSQPTGRGCTGLSARHLGSSRRQAARHRRASLADDGSDRRRS